MVHNKMDQQQLLRHAARYINIMKTLLRQADELGAMSGWPEPQRLAIRRLLTPDMYPADGLSQGRGAPAICLQGPGGGVPPVPAPGGHRGDRGLGEGGGLASLNFPMAAIALPCQADTGDGSGFSSTSGTVKVESCGEKWRSGTGSPDMPALRLGLSRSSLLIGARSLDAGMEVEPARVIKAAVPDNVSPGPVTDTSLPMSSDLGRGGDIMNPPGAGAGPGGAVGGGPPGVTAGRSQSQSLPSGLPRAFSECTPVPDMPSSPSNSIRGRTMSQPTEHEVCQLRGVRGGTPGVARYKSSRMKLVSRESAPVHLPSVASLPPLYFQSAAPGSAPGVAWRRGPWLEPIAYASTTSFPPGQIMSGQAGMGAAAPEPMLDAETREAPPPGLPMMPGGFGTAPGSTAPFGEPDVAVQLPAQPPWTPPRHTLSLPSEQYPQGCGNMQYMLSPPEGAAPQGGGGPQQGFPLLQQPKMEVPQDPQGFVMLEDPSQHQPEGYPNVLYARAEGNALGPPQAPSGPPGPPMFMAQYSSAPAPGPGYTVAIRSQGLEAVPMGSHFSVSTRYPDFAGQQAFQATDSRGHAMGPQGLDGPGGQLQYMVGVPPQHQQYGSVFNPQQVYQQFPGQVQMNIPLAPRFASGGFPGSTILYGGVQYMKPQVAAAAAPGFPMHTQVGLLTSPLDPSNMCLTCLTWLPCDPALSVSKPARPS